MIYGNTARSIITASSPNYKKLVNESFIIGNDDKMSLVEDMTYSILYDDENLLEYCTTYSDPDVLNEAVSDVIKSVGEFIQSIIDKVKEFFHKITEKISNFFNKRKFSTDDKGDLKPEAVEKIENSSSGEEKGEEGEEKSSETSSSSTQSSTSKQIGTSKSNARSTPPNSNTKAITGSKQKALRGYTEIKYHSLYDLVDKNLSEEIEIPANDISNGPERLKAYTSYVDKVFKEMKRTVALDRMYPASDENEEQKASAEIFHLKNEIEQSVKKVENFYKEFNGETKKVTKVTNPQISEIIKGTGLEEKECKDYMKKSYDEVSNLLSDSYKYMKSSKADDGPRRKGELNMSDEDMKAGSKYNAAVSSLFTYVAKNAYKVYTDYCSSIQKYITQCTTARMKLENELYRANRYGFAG